VLCLCHRKLLLRTMTRTAGRFKLAQPIDIKEEEEWIAIPRISRTVPFGYVLDEHDDEILRPVKKELDLLEKAKKYLVQYSYREVANWLSTNSGRYISHVGLRKRVDNERQRKNEARNLRKWAEDAEKAIAKAKALEEERTGARTASTSA
jgi:hypothetical protein